MKTELITSSQNPRIKALAVLRRKGAGSGDTRILIDGSREISRALQAGLAIEELYHCTALLEENSGTLLNDAASRGAQMIEVPDGVFEKIRYGDRTSGLVAVAQRPHKKLVDLKLSAAPLIAVMEHVGKPGNLGAILRSADGAGVEAVLVVESEIDVYGPNVIRASIGTIFSVPVMVLTTEEALTFLNERKIQIVAASPDGVTDYTEINYRMPTAFVLGAEDRGLSSKWRTEQVRRVKIPMRGIADSLNVSTAAALLFYEAVRQRK